MRLATLVLSPWKAAKVVQIRSLRKRAINLVWFLVDLFVNILEFLDQAAARHLALLGLLRSRGEGDFEGREVKLIWTENSGSLSTNKIIHLMIYFRDLLVRLKNRDLSSAVVDLVLPREIIVVDIKFFGRVLSVSADDTVAYCRLVRIIFFFLISATIVVRTILELSLFNFEEMVLLLEFPF